MSFRDKFARFMYGRNGVDDLSRFISYFNLGVILIGAVLSIVLRKAGATMIPALALFIISIVLIVFQYWRVFSKNIELQQKMNRWYLNRKYYLKVWIEKRKSHRQQAKIYAFFKCPKCGQKVRVPRGKGRIAITCPKCKLEFVRKS